MMSKKEIALNLHNQKNQSDDSLSSLGKRLLNHYLRQTYIQDVGEKAAAVAELEINKEL